MNKIRILLLVLLVPMAIRVEAQQKPALSWKEVSKWNYIRPGSNVLSPGGQWMAWTAGPSEGDLQVIIRKTSDSSKLVFPVGATMNPVSFSKDSKFAAFKVSAKDAEVKAAKKTMKPTYDKLMLVTLPGNVKTTFEKVKSFSFSGDSPEWIAIQFVAAENAPKDKDAPKGTDLLIYNLNTKKSFNLGSVSEYEFNKAGNQLAYTIDATGQNGNGVFLRDMKTGLIAALDNDKSVYKNLNWNEKGDAFALIKSNKNEAYKDDVYSVIGINKIAGENSNKVIYSGIDKTGFPKGKGINSNSNPYWSDDQATLFFGINTLDKKDNKTSDSKKDSTLKAKTIGTDTAGKSKGDPKALAKADIEKPDMIIWNWKDKRLQSAQQTQEMRDKSYSYLSAFRIADQRFVQLADSNMRNVTIAPKGLYAIGYDNSSYELMSNLDGQSYTDIYLINLATGAKKRIFEKQYSTGRGGLTLAPNGKWASFYNDGAYFSIDLETGAQYNLTGKIKSSFVDELDDHNVLKPATPSLGWSADSKYVLI
ncbi:MAG: S9 family peptidase, partial [Pedobacter sp.]